MITHPLPLYRVTFTHCSAPTTHALLVVRPLSAEGPPADRNIHVSHCIDGYDTPPRGVCNRAHQVPAILGHLILCQALRRGARGGGRPFNMYVRTAMCHRNVREQGAVREYVEDVVLFPAGWNRESSRSWASVGWAPQQTASPGTMLQREYSGAQVSQRLLGALLSVLRES